MASKKNGSSKNGEARLERSLRDTQALVHAIAVGVSEWVEEGRRRDAKHQESIERLDRNYAEMRVQTTEMRVQTAEMRAQNVVLEKRTTALEKSTALLEKRTDAMLRALQQDRHRLDSRNCPKKLTAEC